MIIPGLPEVGGMELLILLVIILLLFGAKRVPSLARSMGSSLGEFRKGVSGHYDEDGTEELSGEADKPNAAG
jgi:sec-independent protein translocase protein TatA